LPSTSSSPTPPDPATDAADPVGPTRRGKWLLAGIALAVVLIVGGITTAMVRSSGSDANSSAGQVVPKALSAKVGEAAPDFSLDTLDGKTVKLSDFRGKPVVLNFWASWCTPCRKEFPMLKDAYAAGNGKWSLVGVNTQDLIESDGRNFAKAQGATWPNGFDADSAVKKGYGVTGLPETFFIDKDGVIRGRIYQGLRQQDLDTELAKIGAA